MCVANLASSRIHVLLSTWNLIREIRKLSVQSFFDGDFTLWIDSSGVYVDASYIFVIITCDLLVNFSMALGYLFDS